MTIRAECHTQGDLTVFVGGHSLALDGEKEGHPYALPTSPVELLVAALAACMASSGRQFLHRAGLEEGLVVESAFDMSEAHPDHIVRISFTVTIPSGIPTGLREALAGVLNHCAVHTPLHLAPTVEVAVRERQTTASGADAIRGDRPRFVRALVR